MGSVGVEIDSDFFDPYYLPSVLGSVSLSLGLACLPCFATILSLS